MTVIQIFGIISGVTITLTVIIVLTKYRFFRINETQIVYKRLWFYKPTLIIERNVINEICHTYLCGKPTGTYLITENKKLIIPPKVSKDQILHFAVSNKVTLVEEEGFHGGERIVLYESNK